MNLNASLVEDATLTWFGELDHAIGPGPNLPMMYNIGATD
jgi:hypothetical protein